MAEDRQASQTALGKHSLRTLEEHVIRNLLLRMAHEEILDRDRESEQPDCLGSVLVRDIDESLIVRGIQRLQTVLVHSGKDDARKLPGEGGPDVVGPVADDKQGFRTALIQSGREDSVIHRTHHERGMHEFRSGTLEIEAPDDARYVFQEYVVDWPPVHVLPQEIAVDLINGQQT